MSPACAAKWGARKSQHLLEETRAHAIDLDNTATPLFLINGELVAGFSRDLLNARLREATSATRRR